MMRLWKYGVAAMMLIVTISAASAVPGADFVDPCYSASWTENGELTQDLTITNTCINSNSIVWSGDLNLTVLGNVTDDEVMISDRWMYVDTSLRPDLDASATLTFYEHAFAIEPSVEEDGSACATCNVTYSKSMLTVGVDGFSNYTLQGRQDFTVYSDYEPELADKVYQTVDLGDTRRNDEYACIVQVFGRNDNGELILVQTNPEREPQGNVLGDPDTNQPESLGYFPTKNGMANTYFRNDNLAGYLGFELVIQCTSTTEKLIYEESIMTQYSPLGRTLTGRGIWINEDENAFYLSVWVIGGFFALLFGGMVWRAVKL